MTLDVDNHVSLECDRELDKDEVRAWFNCVKASTPSGLTRTVQTSTDRGLMTVALIVRNESDKHTYTVPLSRNLTEDEGEKLVAAYEAPEGLEFDVSISSSYDSLVPDARAIAIDDVAYSELCSSWAKRQHDTWMADRLSGGWRYGPEMSLTQKTHPMLRQWSELPADQRGVDTDAPSNMIKLLNDEGFFVVRKSEIEAIENLLRSVAGRKA